MLDTVSIHHESVATTLGNLWGDIHAHRQTPATNLALLESKVEQLAREDANSIGKKRSAEPEESPQDTKRTKTTNGSHTPPANRGTYPPLPVGNWKQLKLVDEARREAQEKVVVLKHTLDIHYDQQNQSMAESLQGKSTVHLGPLHLHEHLGRIVASTEEAWLFVLPRVDEGIDVEDDDYTLSPPVVDLIFACEALRRAEKAHLDASYSLIMADDATFRIQVEVFVSLSVPNIFYPLSQKEPKRHFDLVANAQRRVLGHIYGEAPPEGGNPTVNISYFYSALQSAPPLPSAMADDATQPELLNPTLLPFQRRSVGWLLQREGLDVTPQGEIVPASSLKDYTFWSTVVEGNHTWYYNHLSGVLTPEAPDESPASRGGILAEEPGLGKTLEMISLVLLNPPGPERNPSVTTWDPEARLDVKAIKTSLIVTPPALASQWVDEIAAHAPTLKVLVYDGWNKVKVPITRSQTEQERALEATKTAKREKAEREKNAKLAAARLARSGKSVARQTKSKSKTELDPDLVDAGPDLTRDKKGNLLEWCDFVQQYDIVITTYQVLRSDFNVARAPPVRPRREDVKYVNVERPRSPLVMVEWNRVIMDEVQMVGGANLEDMVSLIPRLSSFAVSGTPARAQVADLIHVVKFLRVFDIVGSEKLWKRLIKPGFARKFAEFFQTYTIRTTKASVKQELTIPQQTRYLVPIELGKIEQHVYDQALEAILLELGLDARGVAASGGWEVDGTVLRNSIRKLRGICTHPQVGQLQRRGEAGYKRGALKSMEAVLENMRDQNWRNIMEDWREKVQLIIRYAQLIQRDVPKERVMPLALDAFDTAETEIDAHIKEIETALEEHHAKGEVLKREAAVARQVQADAEAARALEEGGDDATTATGSSHKGKGKAREWNGDIQSDNEDDGDDEEEENVEDKGLPKTPAGKEHRAKTQGLKARLREAKLILHRVKFLKGDLFHNMERSDDEDAAYAAAEQLRKGLLKTSEEDASRAMAQLGEDLTKKRLDLGDLDVEVPFVGEGGLRSALLFEETNEIIENVLNKQAALLIAWRTKIVSLLTTKLTGRQGDDEEDGDGQEYQRNLDNQGEAEVYMQAYAALLADRREALVNERTLLAAHDVREKKLRHTKAAMKAAQALDRADDAFVSNVEEIDLLPEHEVMYKGLSEQRKALIKKLDGRAIKSIVVDLQGVLQRIIEAQTPEKTLIKDALGSLRSLMTSQSQLHDKLDADLVLIRRAFNERILYFRQLQEISDSVAEVQWDQPTLEMALEDCEEERVELEGKINTNRARHRYLVNLVNNKGKVEDGEDEDEENTCILCRCDFMRGFITQCAHIFCEGCMKAWLQRREGKTCPVCRVAIDPDTVQRFTVNATDVEAPKQPINGQPAPQSTRKIEYNKIDPGVFDKILKVEALGDFGTKIQTLVQHLLYLQAEDPGAKSIVFSAWADSLHIVEWALSTNGIRCLRIDQKSKGESAAKKFRTDPDIPVLLLHGERENAGLNVTCASRVFLLESVVHHSFEIQAIARIDRMGQTRPTEVYCYYAEDTVERNILDLAARKGLSLYTKDKAAGTLDVTSFSQENDRGVVDSPAKMKKSQQKGDFIFKIDDMLAILFPHMYEDIEYLIPPEELNGDVEMADGTLPNGADTSHPVPPVSGAPTRARVQTNAVAGPSRQR